MKLMNGRHDGDDLSAGGELGQGPPDALAPGGEPLGAAPEKDSALSKHMGFVLLGLVVVIAGSLLYGMRAYGLSGRLEVLDIKIDYFPKEDEVEQRAAAEHERLLEALKASTQVVQVPPERVQMNPFRWSEQNETVDHSAVDDQARRQAEAIRREKERQRQAVQSAFDRLVLRSVMGGRVPVAQVSGELVREGERLGDHFTVRQIRRMRVILESDDGRLFELEHESLSRTPG